MLKINFLLIFIMTLLTSCNFESTEQTADGGGLFSNNREVVNGFTITTQVNKTLTTGEQLLITATHPYPLNVTGTPQIQINLDGNIVNANFQSGSGTKSLSFIYTIKANDLDLDGIELSDNISLNSGTIQFSANGEILNADTNSLIIPDTKELRVDATSASVSLITPPVPTTYYTGQKLTFIALFTKPVSVMGVPSLAINVGGQSLQAHYLSGSGSSSIIFQYSVNQGDFDIDGITMHSPLELNSGAINDLSGNAVALEFLELPMPLTHIDGQAAFIKNLVVPADKKYLLGDKLSLQLEFNEEVQVLLGTPTIELKIGEESVAATYRSGSGTNTLVFDYIVEQGLLDLDGISLQNIIKLNGSSLTDLSLTPVQLQFSAPLTPQVQVDSRVPEVISLSSPPAGKYITDQELKFTINFSESVVVTDSPKLLIKLSSGVVFAHYESGSTSSSLIFSYTLKEDDNDSDGIEFSSPFIELGDLGEIRSITTTNNAQLNFAEFEPSMNDVKVNTDQASQIVITTQPLNSFVSQPLSQAIHAQLRDESNNLVNSSSAAVTISFSEDPSAASATIQGTTTLNAVAGIVVFDDITIDKINDGYSFTLSSPNLTSATTSTFNVTQAPVTQLVFIQDPLDAIAGEIISPQIQVELRDVNNNLVPTANEEVTLSFGNDPSAGSSTLSGTKTVTSINGVATFSDISVDKALVGYSLKASNSALALTSIQSTLFDISPATKSKLTFIVNPTDTSLETIISPTIEIEIQDIFGNKTNDNDNVTLTINNDPTNGAANLSGTLTKDAVNGLISFTDVMIDTIGSGYTLKASSAEFSDSSTLSFDVLSGPATKLIIKQQPNNSSRDTIISPSLSVEIQDDHGNLVTSATNTINVSLGSDPSSGTASLSGSLSVQAIDGIANFDNLKVDTAGDGYTLIFESDSLLAQASDAFTIFDLAALSFNSSTSYDYGVVPLGDSKDSLFLISHSGVQATNLAEITMLPPFSFKGGSFPGLGGTCSSTVSSNCTLNITYTPTDTTMSNGVITLAYNNGSISTTIAKNISGTGLNSNPSAIKLEGPTAVITSHCVPYIVKSVDDDSNTANVSSDENISLVVNNGTGSFYSDQNCTSPTTTTVITSGASSADIYFKTLDSNQNLTLILNAVNLENTSAAVASSNEPVDIIANISEEVIVDSCSQASVSLVDTNGVKTGASSAQIINLIGSGNLEIYNDSYCTGLITQLSFSKYEATKYIYLKNANIEQVTLSLEDNTNFLNSDTTSVEFISTLTWWDSSFTKRVKISLNNLDQTLSFTDLPVLVKLDSSKINYSELLTQGQDIRFTLSDHSTNLSYSIEDWNPSGISYIWVKVPSISASSQMDIYMYYKNNSATNSEDNASVWVDYAGVWLMNKDGVNYKDETGSGKTGTPSGNGVSDIKGPVGNAIHFDGTSSLSISYNLALSLGSTSTLSFWLRTNQIGDATDWRAPGITGMSGTNPSQDLFYGYIKDSGHIGSSAGGGSQVESNFIVNDNTWRHITVSRDETSGEFSYYVNGVLNGSGGSSPGLKSTPFYDFGATTKAWGGGGFIFLEGSMDSIRMSNSVLSPARIKAEYKFTTETNMTYSPPQEI